MWPKATAPEPRTIRLDRASSVRRLTWLSGAVAVLVAATGCNGPAPQAQNSGEPAGAATGPTGGASDPPAPSRPGKAPADQAGTDPAARAQQGMIWHFSRTPQGPKLVYGERSTDNVRLMMRCPPGGASVILSFIRPDDLVERRPAELELRSADAATTLSIDSQESQLGGRVVQAVAPIDAQPLQRFRSGSALEVRWGEETISLPAAGAYHGRIRQFFETCGPTG